MKMSAVIFLFSSVNSFLGYQVLIFSQWTKILDIMDYYFSEKGFEVCRIDGGVNLAERRRQVLLRLFFFSILVWFFVIY